MVYLGLRSIKISSFNVPVDLPENILTANLSEYGEVEGGIHLCTKNGTPNGDYTFTKKGIPKNSRYYNLPQPTNSSGRGRKVTSVMDLWLTGCLSKTISPPQSQQGMHQHQVPQVPEWGWTAVVKEERKVTHLSHF